jgi:hypothetical protein
LAPTAPSLRLKSSEKSVSVPIDARAVAAASNNIVNTERQGRRKIRCAVEGLRLSKAVKYRLMPDVSGNEEELGDAETADMLL